MDQIISIGLILIVLGVLAVLFGLFIPLLTGQEKAGTEIHGGAVLFIGPIPIILGTDKGSAITVAVLAIVLIALAYVFLSR
jgi:uncharacterized protein (TIGR00304 family)